MPISTFPRHDYDEDEYLLKPAGLRDTHSEARSGAKLGWEIGQNKLGDLIRRQGIVKQFAVWDFVGILLQNPE